jgi:hypothetical protein
MLKFFGAALFRETGCMICGQNGHAETACRDIGRRNNIFAAKNYCDRRITAVFHTSFPYYKQNDIRTPTTQDYFQSRGQRWLDTHGQSHEWAIEQWYVLNSSLSTSFFSRFNSRFCSYSCIVEVLAKLEYTNFTGSIKERTAKFVIEG